MKNEKEILKILKKENKTKNIKKHDRIMVLFEIKKVKSNLGIINGKYYREDELIYQGSIVLPLEKNPNQKTIWDQLNIDETKDFGFLLDSKKDSFGKIFNDFIKRSFKEGKVQDFLKG